jgi:hypothetical protein
MKNALDFVAYLTENGDISAVLAEGVKMCNWIWQSRLFLW